jgi:hypothetical protein
MVVGVRGNRISDNGDKHIDNGCGDNGNGVLVAWRAR